MVDEFLRGKRKKPADNFEELKPLSYRIRVALCTSDFHCFRHAETLQAGCGLSSATVRLPLSD